MRPLAPMRHRVLSQARGHAPTPPAGSASTGAARTSIPATEAEAAP